MQGRRVPYGGTPGFRIARLPDKCPPHAQGVKVLEKLAAYAEHPSAQAASVVARRAISSAPLHEGRAAVPPANGTGGAGDLHGLKVMVIDDSKTIRRTAETLLKRQGCEVETANDGFEALSKVAEFRPDIIFVDIMMPRLDGYQTCALIKQNNVFRKTPVIMLSSKDSIFDKARGRIVGSEEYLTKPFTKDDLLEAIKRFT